MAKKIFALLLAFSMLHQTAHAWWGADNNYRDRNNTYEFGSRSFKQNDWNNNNFNFSSTQHGQSYITARDNFFKNPLYESKIRVESSNPDFRSFIDKKVAPNISGADYGGYKISNNAKFESYSSLIKKYESFSFSNVKETNGMLSGFDRTTGRSGWLVTENIRNLSYSNDGRLSSYQLSTKDIAGNSLTQNISNLRYMQSSDASRLTDMQSLADRNTGREGYFMWNDIRSGLEGMDQPAALVPASFNLSIRDANGVQGDFAFTDVMWRNDRMVGFTASFMPGGAMNELKAIPTLNESGKIEALTIQISKGGATEEKSWNSSSGVNLGAFVAAMFKGLNPLLMLGAGHMQVSDMMIPAAATTFDERGVLPNAEKDFTRNYGIEDNPTFGKAANIAKKEIFQLEQTDEVAARSALWNTNLNDLSTKVLENTVTNIQTAIENKISNIKNVDTVSTDWGDTLKPTEPLQLKLENNQIKSPNTFTNAKGEKITDVTFTIKPDGNLSAFSGTKETASGQAEKVGSEFKLVPDQSLVQTAKPQGTWDTFKAKAVDVIDKWVVKPIKGLLSIVFGGQVEKETNPNMTPITDNIKIAQSGLPKMENVQYMENVNANTDTEKYSYVEFNIRNSYRTWPILGALPHFPKIGLANGEKNNDVAVGFNQTPKTFADSIINSKSINLLVHGYNVDEIGALKFQETLINSLKSVDNYGNVNALISWKGNVGDNILSESLYFNRAAQSADLSWPAVKTAEMFLHNINPDLKLNVVTHSLGARLILDAAANGVHFNTVILLVPAIDNESLSQGGKFEKALENIDNLVVVYSKHQEFVFGASYRTAKFDTAMGYKGPSGNYDTNKIRVIDASNFVANHGDIYNEKLMQEIVPYLR